MTKTSRKGIGKIATAATVIAMIVIVVGVGTFFGSQGPPVTDSPPTTFTASQTSSSISATNQTSSSSSTTQSTCTVPNSGSGNVTITVTAEFPPCGCTLVDSNANGSLYVSSNAKVGDNVCISASLDNSASVYLSVMNPDGSVVFSAGTCVASPPPGASPPTGDSCTAYWNTANPGSQVNPIKPGTYLLAASDYEGSAIAIEANFTLS
jgi:hypothetical protein